MPTALFAVGVVGLVAALVGEGVWDAAGSAALSVLVVLPAILAYSVWVYWVFRGKVTADAGYH